MFFTLTPEALRTIRVDELRLSTDELGALLFRGSGHAGAVEAYESGSRRIPASVAFAVEGFRARSLLNAARAARATAFTISA